MEQIAARLDDRFRLLTGGSRTALPRQQTLRGAVDWSYDLLSEPEQVLFAGSPSSPAASTLEAAERVGSAETLVSLVEKSLVQVDEGADGEIRYWLLETFREYGHERLIEHGELSAVRDRHRDYWLGVVEEAQPRLDGAGQLVTLGHLDREHDNLRASLAWCLESAARQQTEPGPIGHPPSRTPAEIGIQLAGALWRFWWLRGHIGEGRRWFKPGVGAALARR